MTIQMTKMAGIIKDEFAQKYFISFRFRKASLPMEIVQHILDYGGRETMRCTGVNCHNQLVRQKEFYGQNFVYAFQVVEDRPICHDCVESEQFDIVTMNLG